MFSTLLESKHSSQRTTGSAVLSTAVHVVLIVGAVYATARGGEPAGQFQDTPAYVAIPPQAEPPPEDRRAESTPPPVSAPLPKRFQELIAPIVVPRVVPDIDIFASVTDPTSFGGVREVTGFPDRIAGVTSSAGDPDAPRFAAQVDRVASLKPGNPEPAYPSILRQTRQIGKVMTAFVVDTTGRAVMSTLKIVETSNPLFSEEVRKVLGRYRFNPAEVNGRKVPMHVQLPFDFRLTTDSRGGHREFR